MIEASIFPSNLTMDAHAMVSCEGDMGGVFTWLWPRTYAGNLFS
jgi:hypothetical protein